MSSTSGRWHIGLPNGTRAGPLTDEAAAQLLNDGGTWDSALVWRTGLAGWVTVGESELASLRPSPSAEPPPLPGLPAMPPALPQVPQSTSPPRLPTAPQPHSAPAGTSIRPNQATGRHQLSAAPNVGDDDEVDEAYLRRRKASNTYAAIRVGLIAIVGIAAVSYLLVSQSKERAEEAERLATEAKVIAAQEAERARREAQLQVERANAAAAAEVERANAAAEAEAARARREAATPRINPGQASCTNCSGMFSDCTRVNCTITNVGQVGAYATLRLYADNTAVERSTSILERHQSETVTVDIPVAARGCRCEVVQSYEAGE